MIGWFRSRFRRVVGNHYPAGYVDAPAPSPAALTASDRCDRCGAQAYLRVELQSGGELLFCAHHAREHGDKIREIASQVHDETHKLQS